MENLILDIVDFGKINSANINLNKINVIGGVNASGKSTAARLLYCFLKALSSNRDEFILEYILPDINGLINRAARAMGDESTSKYNYSIHDNFEKILLDYDRARQIINSVSFPDDDILGRIIKEVDEFLSIIISDNNHSYSPILKILFETESLYGFKGNVTFYNDSFKSSVNYNPSGDWIYDQGSVYNQNTEQNSFDDYDNEYGYLTEGTFDYISDVFYIDSVSIFDLDYYINTKNSFKRIFKYKEHLDHLLKQLRDYNSNVDLSDEVKFKIEEVYKNIKDIIMGESLYESLIKINKIQEDAFYFKQEDGEEFRVNISSGIQQIAVVQTLLHNKKLIPGTYLIIDEPEVNLHPEWQIKFAEILVLLVKELDIKLYLNSHSPMFIEAISLYSEYYDLLEDTNFYLTEKQGNDKFNFIKIDPKDMGAVYENLTKPYDELDKLKAKILFKE